MKIMILKIDFGNRLYISDYYVKAEPCQMLQKQTEYILKLHLGNATSRVRKKIDFTEEGNVFWKQFFLIKFTLMTIFLIHYLELQSILPIV